MLLHMDPLKGDNSKRSQWAPEGGTQEVKAHLECEISNFPSKMFFSDVSGCSAKRS